MSTPALDIRITQLLAHFAARFPKRVRDLAEMIAEATANYRLQDDADEITAVFRECVALYCQHHGIAPEQLHVAVLEYTSIDRRAAVD